MIDLPRLILLPPAAPATSGVPAAARLGPVAVAPARPIRAAQDERALADKRLLGPDDRAPEPSTEPSGKRGPAPGPVALTSIGREGPLAFLAQHIAQEVLSAGLYREPWRLGDAAYRRAGGEPRLPGSAPAAISLAV